MVTTSIRVQNVRISGSCTQAVKFRLTKKGVRCTSRGLPRIVIAREDGHFVGVVPGIEGAVHARTAAKTFARAVRHFWATA